MSLYTHGQDIGLGFGICGLGPLIQIIIIFYYFKKMCLFSNVYIHSPLLTKNNFWETPREKIFCALAFESKREKET